VLSDAQARGYEIRSLESVWAAAEVPARFMALRHDVERPSSSLAREFFKRELSIGARSTFYFRLTTFPANETLVGELLEAGFDVGYHYEEAADVAKERGVRSRPGLDEHAGLIHDRFRANVESIRSRHHPGLRSVSSHGEWINSRLGFTNREFVSPELLEECGLWFEAYHPLFVEQARYVSDVAVFPERWTDGYTVTSAIDDGHTRICVLTHPNRWFRAPASNAGHLVRRGLDEVRYRLRTSRGFTRSRA